MSRKQITVLLIEDNPGDARLTQEMLAEARGLRCDLEWVDSLAAGLQRLAEGGIDLVLLDLGLPDSMGLDTLRHLRAGVPQSVAVLVMTGQGEDDVALQAVQAGAQDYLVKGEINSDLLIRSMLYAIERQENEEALRQARTELEHKVQERTAELDSVVHSLEKEIAERKQAEAELLRLKESLEEEVQQRTAELVLARDAADAANKAKSVFLANMSHELRTPLNAILGFSSLMSKDPLLPDGDQQSIDIINRSGKHLLTLINDVLEMAKIEAGRIQLENLPFDLGAMVRDVTDMMAQRAKVHGLQLLIDQSSDFPRYIIGDEIRLNQILINLLGNAIKYTQHGGVTLRLGTKKNRISHLLIEVEDSGVGISPEDQQLIFEPFTQLSGQGVAKGTGLGLTITHQFVEMMGGSISLESTLGKGSLFRVVLPLMEAKESDISRPEQIEMGEVVGIAPNQPEYRILIVEDQRDNQLLLARLLEAVGFHIKIAENGEQGVQLFQSWHPHFIWMDRRMPVMDGMEATRRIRELPGGKEVKIVAVTASVFTEELNKMLAVGMDDNVRKPFRASEIYDCMGKHLGVKYIYDGAPELQEQDVRLTPDMLEGLPDALRCELIEALENLDRDHINKVIKKVAIHDETLQKKLSQIAGGFDYPAILQVLRKTGS